MEVASGLHWVAYKHGLEQEISAALPPMVKHAIAVGHMSNGRVVKGIEQTWCRASKSAWGDGKFAATMW